MKESKALCHPFGKDEVVSKDLACLEQVETLYDDGNHQERSIKRCKVCGAWFLNVMAMVNDRSPSEDFDPDAKWLQKELGSRAGAYRTRRKRTASSLRTWPLRLNLPDF